MPDLMKNWDPEFVAWHKYWLVRILFSIFWKYGYIQYNADSRYVGKKHRTSGRVYVRTKNPYFKEWWWSKVNDKHWDKFVADKNYYYWIYGTCRDRFARKHRKEGNVQFILAKKGEYDQVEDYWHNFDSSWWDGFQVYKYNNSEFPPKSVN